MYYIPVRIILSASVISAIPGVLRDASNAACSKRDRAAPSERMTDQEMNRSGGSECRNQDGPDPSIRRPLDTPQDRLQPRRLYANLKASAFDPARHPAQLPRQFQAQPRRAPAFFGEKCGSTSKVTLSY